MKLIIEWDTPEECIEQIAQIYYLMATNTRDSLNAVLAKLDAECSPSEPAPEVTEKVATPAPKAQKKTTKAKESPKAEPKTEPEPEEATPQPVKAKTAKPVITMPELQALAISKTKEHGREPLKAVLEELGAAKVTAILPEQFEAAKALLEAING